MQLFCLLPWISFPIISRCFFLLTRRHPKVAAQKSRLCKSNVWKTSPTELGLGSSRLQGNTASKLYLLSMMYLTKQLSHNSGQAGYRKNHASMSLPTIFECLQVPFLRVAVRSRSMWPQPRVIRKRHGIQNLMTGGFHIYPDWSVECIITVEGARSKTRGLTLVGVYNEFLSSIDHGYNFRVPDYPWSSVDSFGTLVKCQCFSEWHFNTTKGEPSIAFLSN